MRKTRKITALLLVLLLVLTLPSPVYADDAARSETGGMDDTARDETGSTDDTANDETGGTDDTANDVDIDKFYQDMVTVNSVQDLRTLEKLCSLDTYSRGKTFLLEQDIDLENQAISLPSFGGIFDGQGHTISGLQISDSMSVCGLFAVVQESGEIRRLNVQGMIVPDGSPNQTGGIAGSNGGLILECSFSGLVHGTNYVGGIAGNNETTGQLVNNTVTGAVIGTHFTGGITGQNEGVVYSCENQAAVNTVLTEEQTSLEGLSDMVYRLWKNYTTGEETPATTDTGGIAGYSTGIIRASSNSGDVGYPHVGYNVGGIVGRQCGYMEQCSNEGHIYGRKDVGGIAGQMVPNISLTHGNSAMAEIRSELETLQTMLDQLLNDAGNAGDTVYARLQQISAHTDSARESARWMGDYMVDYANDGINQINDASATVASYQSRLHSIQNEFEAARTRLSNCRKDLTNLREKMEDSESMDRLMELTDQLDAQLQDLWQESEDGNFDIGTLRDRFQGVNDTLSAIRDEANNVFGDEEKEELDSIRDEFNGACDDLDVSARDLQQCLSDILDEEPVSVPAIDGEFSNRSQQLSSSLSAISGQLSLMNDEMRGSKDTLLTDMHSINTQFMKVMNLFLDALDEVQDLSYEDVYEDISDADIVNTTQGKVQGCANAGVVEADVNVGGIAGAMAMEYDLDPEDDEKDAEHKTYRYTYQTRAILIDCINYGEVLAKKNCAGGMAGRMDLGIIVNGQNYGIISSSGGDYVGGISGYSLSTIRDSSAKCILGGGKYIGGIAGSGGTVNRCRSMVSIVAGEQFTGAIAGEVEGAANENYFVSERLAGIDRVSYTGQAQGVTYEEMLALPGTPDTFRTLAVTFRTDDRTGETKKGQQDLKNYEYTVQRTDWLPYKSRISATDYPRPETPEGYYLTWDQPEIESLTADTVVTGSYLQYATLLSADDLQKDQRPAILVEGQFKQGDTVTATRAAVQDGDTASRASTGQDGDTKTRVAVQDGNTASGASSGNNDGATATADSRIDGHDVLEHWIVSWPDDGLETRNLRYHPDGGDTKNLQIYIKEENGWKKANATVSGGHLLIPATGNEIEFAVVKAGGNFVGLIVAGCVLAVIAAGTVCLKIRKRKKNI